MRSLVSPELPIVEADSQANSKTGFAKIIVDDDRTEVKTRTTSVFPSTGISVYFQTGTAPVMPPEQDQTKPFIVYLNNNGLITPHIWDV